MEDFDTDLLLLELEIAIKHGSHNQASHGRKTGRRAAFSSAYSAARSGGASVSEARAKAREASTAFRDEERSARAASPAKPASTRESISSLSRQRKKLQADNERLMKDVGAAYRRAGEPGLSSTERKQRQKDVDSLEQKLRELQTELRQVSGREIRMVREREGS